jgi:hypothetical protein
MIGTKSARRSTATVGLVVALTLAATACGGGGDTDTPTTTTTTVALATEDTTPLVKNRPLNNCVSVFSGERPTNSRPLTREELIAQREAEIAARPPECQPKRR